MIFLKKFKKKVSFTFTEHVNRTDIIVINQLCYGYNTDVSRIKNTESYNTTDLKYLKYGICMLWIRFRYFSLRQVFILCFNIMPPIVKINSKGNPYLSRHFILCINYDYTPNKTEIQYNYKTKKTTCALFGHSYKIEKTNTIKYVLPYKIVVDYIKN
jgi:hypothetical protein